MKTRIQIILLIVILSILTGIPGSGQTSQSKVSLNESVYLRTDHDQYIAGSLIFFKAYIFSDLSVTNPASGDSLYVSLIDQDGLNVVSEKFPVNDFEAGGYLELSQYLTAGYYILLACTSTMKDGDPDLIFPKIIEVVNPKNSGISVEITLKDSLYRPGNLLSSEINFSDKKDKPVAASFTYHLQNNKGDICKGEGKTNKEGKAEIKVPLPAFQTNDNIKLMVEVTYKGNNVINGIVIPTPYNQKDLELKSEITAIKNTYKQLKIRISTDKPQYRKNEKVFVNINATDNKGGPVVARLSISASSTQSSLPWFQNQDIVDFIIHRNNLSEYDAPSDAKYPQLITNGGPSESENGFIFSSEVSKYFAQYLLQITHAPGHPFNVQEQNDIKKISKDMKPDNSVNQYGYTADRNILDIIKQMKPCHVAEGKIVFSTGGIGSINFPEGALIIIDGIKMGTDVQILNTISVTDIAKINISTNPSEIQRYTGLNSSGIIEIFMKKGPESLAKTNQKDQDKSGIICWEPDILTDSSGKASVSYLNKSSSNSMIITVEGVSADGLAGCSSIQYTVK